MDNEKPPISLKAFLADMEDRPPAGVASQPTSPKGGRPLGGNDDNAFVKIIKSLLATPAVLVILVLSLFFVVACRILPQRRGTQMAPSSPLQAVAKSMSSPKSTAVRGYTIRTKALRKEEQARVERAAKFLKRYEAQPTNSRKQQALTAMRELQATQRQMDAMVTFAVPDEQQAAKEDQRHLKETTKAVEMLR